MQEVPTRTEENHRHPAIENNCEGLRFKALDDPPLLTKPDEAFRTPLHVSKVGTEHGVP